MAVKKPRNLCVYCNAEVKRHLAKYCSQICQVNWQYEEYINRWKRGEESGIRLPGGLSNHIRRYMIDKHQSMCQECGWSKINPYTGKIPLTIDHADGNWQNCTEDNLRVLCPSCHSLTPTYGAMNKGSGRKHRLQTGDSTVGM